jgi:hypothetical protein
MSGQRWERVKIDASAIGWSRTESKFSADQEFGERKK